MLDADSWLLLRRGEKNFKLAGCRLGINALKLRDEKLIGIILGFFFRQRLMRGHTPGQRLSTLGLSSQQQAKKYNSVHVSNIDINCSLASDGCLICCLTPDRSGELSFEADGEPYSSSFDVGLDGPGLRLRSRLLEGEAVSIDMDCCCVDGRSSSHSTGSKQQEEMSCN